MPWVKRQQRPNILKHLWLLTYQNYRFFCGFHGVISMNTWFKCVCYNTTSHCIYNTGHWIGFCTIYWFYFMPTCGQMNARVGISIYSDKKTGGWRWNLYKYFQVLLSHPWKISSDCQFIALILKGMSSGKRKRGESKEGTVVWSYYSEGWVIFLLSTNLQLLNFQNNSGLNQLIQWSRVKS